MLKDSDKRKIEKYIKNIIDGLQRKAKESLDSGMSDKQVVERITKATVNIMTPESKMIMSSVYNMLLDETLSELQFQSLERKTMLYQMNILKDLNSKFLFEIPDSIDYTESKKELDKLAKWSGGAVIVIGGTVSVKLKNVAPLSISLAIVLAAIMGVIIYNKRQSKDKEKINYIITEYLSNVQTSLMAWIESVERYYDERIEEIKQR